MHEGKDEVKELVANINDFKSLDSNEMYPRIKKKLAEELSEFLFSNSLGTARQMEESAIPREVPEKWR